jgi:ATP-dependent Clp protease ATP-binding subunit ClpC
MKEMMGGLNNSARNALALAQEEVKNFRQNVLGTEHILLGLMLEEESIAGKLLRDKISVDKVREIIKNSTGMGDSVPEYINISPRSKYIIELARQIAAQLKMPYVGSEHILLALIEEGEGIGAQIIKSAVSLRDLKNEVLMAIQGGGGHEQINPDMGGGMGQQDPATKTIDKYGTDEFTCREALERVLEYLKEMKRLATEIRNEADEDGDFEVVGEFEGHVAGCSKNIWFVKSMLT